MKLFIIAIIIAVLSLCETSSGDGVSEKALKLSSFYGDLPSKGIAEGLSQSLSVNTILKPVKVINVGLGEGLTTINGGRRRRGGGRGFGRGRRGRGGRRGGGKLPLHFSGRRLPLPPPKVLFGSSRGRHGRRDGLKLGIAALRGELGNGGGHGYSGGLNGLSAGISSSEEGKLLKGIDYETLFDDNRYHDSSLSIDVGEVKGDVEAYVEEFRDGEVISTEEYDGGYETENGSHY